MATTRCCDVFREHYKRLCDILHTSSTVLASFTIALYTKKIIDLETKSEVLRIEGIKGADALLSLVLLKLQANPKRFTVVLELVLAEDALSDVGKEMESLHLKQNFTISNRRIPIIEAPTTNAIGFAKHLKSVYEELVDVIYDAVRNVDVDKLRVRLNVFFMSDDHIDANDALLCKLDTCKTTEDVLLCLIRANFIGYLNYKLLEVFAKASYNEQVLQSIDDYEKEYLKLFKCDFSSLIKLFRNPRLTAIPPVSLPEFTVRLGTANDQSDLYSFQEFFENRFSWAEHLLILDIVESCILIKYGVLPFFVSAVIRDLTDPTIIEELRKEDITIELSSQLKDIARHHDDQPALESVPSLHDISSSDISLIIRSHDLSMTDPQKSELQTMTSSIITHTDKDHESQVGTVVSEDTQSFAKAAELEDLPMKKLIFDWDEHGESNSSSGFYGDLQDLDILELDVSAAEKEFVYEEALQLLPERTIGTKYEMLNRVMIELKEACDELKIIKDQNEILLLENKLLKDQHSSNRPVKPISDEFQTESNNDPPSHTCVSGHSPPTLDIMCEVLKDLVDWESLVQHVPDITSERIQRIKGQWPSSVDIQKVLFFNQWLLCHLNLSWNDVIDVLVKAGEYKLAIKADAYILYENTKYIRPPTASNMSELLYDLVDWEIFAIHLPNITPSDLERIIKQDHPPSDCKHALFQYWLSVYPNASWDDVQHALHEVSEHEHAWNVMKMFPQLLHPLILHHELKTLKKWEDFGLSLTGITSNDIELIKSKYNDIPSRKLALYHRWISNYSDPDPASWMDVVYALYGASEHKLAMHIRTKWV